MKIKLTENDIKNIVLECCNHLLNESLSDKLYHFTTLKALYSISKRDAFLCSSIYSNAVDKTLNSQYPFYLSFTRQHNNQMGYVQYKNSQAGALSSQLSVRIEVNGQLLNSKYKGNAVNYHYIENGKNKQQQWANGDMLKLVSIRQSEDRLYSREPIIENASKYITRVDILVPPEAYLSKRKDSLEMIARMLLNSPFKDRIFIYNNEKDYNIPQCPNFINHDILASFTNIDRQKYVNGDSDNDYFNQNFQLKRGREAKDYLTPEKIKSIGHFIGILALNDNSSDKESYIEQAANYLLQDYKKDVGATYYNKAYNVVTSSAAKCMKNPNIINNFKYNFFATNLRGDFRIIYGRAMKLLDGVLRKNNTNSFSTLKTNAVNLFV